MASRATRQPYKVETTLGWELQNIAATASAFVLQTIGYPTYQEGVVLHVKDHDLLDSAAVPLDRVHDGPGGLAPAVKPDDVKLAPAHR